MTWYYIHYYRYSGGAQITVWTHKMHLIPRANGRAIWCILRENWRRYNGTTLWFDFRQNRFDILWGGTLVLEPHVIFWSKDILNWTDSTFVLAKENRCDLAFSINVRRRSLTAMYAPILLRNYMITLWDALVHLKNSWSLWMVRCNLDLIGYMG